MSAIKGWERKTFIELGACIRGVSYKPFDLRPAPAKENITLLRSNNIRDGRLNYDNLQFVNQSVVREHQKLQNEDIAICMSNGNRALVGKSGQFVGRGDNAEYTVGAFCSIFRPADGFDAGFIRHLFGSDNYQKQLDGILAGSAINNLKGSDIDGLIALCPTALPEQTKIAEILSTVDRAIEQTEAIIAKQQRIKTGLMHDLLTRGIDEHGNLRSEETHEFKDSLLGRIPVEWEVCQWKEIITKWGYGPRFSAANYSENGNVKTIRGSDFTKDGYVLYSQVPLALLPQIFVARHKLEQNDVVVVTTADCGVTAVFEEQDCDYIASAYAVSYRFYEKVNPHFVKYFMQTDVAKRQVNEYVRQGTLGNLPGSDLLKIWMPLLTLTEQVKHVETLDLSSQSIREQNDYLSKLCSIKTALMQDLLTGKKRVTALLNDTEVVHG